MFIALCSLLVASSIVVPLERRAVSSANVPMSASLMYGMSHVYKYRIGHSTFPWETPALILRKLVNPSSCLTRKYLSKMYDFRSKLKNFRRHLRSFHSRSQCQTLSKACATSRKTAEQIFFSSKFFSMMSVIRCIWSIMKCSFRNPNWWGGINYLFTWSKSF